MYPCLGGKAVTIYTYVRAPDDCPDRDTTAELLIPHTTCMCLTLIIPRVHLSPLLVIFFIISTSTQMRPGDSIRLVSKLPQQEGRAVNEQLPRSAARDACYGHEGWAASVAAKWRQHSAFGWLHFSYKSTSSFRREQQQQQQSQFVFRGRGDPYMLQGGTDDGFPSSSLWYRLF